MPDPTKLIHITAQGQAIDLFGVRLVGMNAENGRKLLLTLGFVTILLVLAWGLKFLKRLGRRRGGRVAFWVAQGISLCLPPLRLQGVDLSSLAESHPSRSSAA